MSHEICAHRREKLHRERESGQLSRPQRVGSADLRFVAFALLFLSCASFCTQLEKKQREKEEEKKRKRAEAKAEAAKAEQLMLAKASAKDFAM